MTIVKTALIYFDQAICDGSIRKASENLNISSSAINRLMLQLEGELGVELFVRLPHGIRPTAAGEALLGTIRRWKSDARQLRHDIERLKGGTHGTVRLAVAESIARDIVPRAMLRLRETFPHVDYTLVSGHNLSIKSELHARNADVICAFDVSPDHQMHAVHYGHAPLGVLMPASHPLAGAGQVTIADCVPYPIVAPQQEWLQHSVIGRLLDDARTPLRIVARVERVSLLTDLVHAGIGIAFLANLGLERDLASGDLVWIPLAPNTVQPVTISILVHQGRTQPAYVTALIDHLKDEIEQGPQHRGGVRASS